MMGGGKRNIMQPNGSSGFIAFKVWVVYEKLARPDNPHCTFK
jgi:hypothetical protein